MGIFFILVYNIFLSGQHERSKEAACQKTGAYHRIHKLRLTSKIELLDPASDTEICCIIDVIITDLAADWIANLTLSTRSPCELYAVPDIALIDGL